MYLFGTMKYFNEGILRLLPRDTESWIFRTFNPHKFYMWIKLHCCFLQYFIKMFRVITLDGKCNNHGITFMEKLNKPTLRGKMDDP